MIIQLNMLDVLLLRLFLSIPNLVMLPFLLRGNFTYFGVIKYGFVGLSEYYLVT